MTTKRALPQDDWIPVDDDGWNVPDETADLVFAEPLPAGCNSTQQMLAQRQADAQASLEPESMFREIAAQNANNTALVHVIDDQSDDDDADAEYNDTPWFHLHEVFAELSASERAALLHTQLLLEPAALLTRTDIDTTRATAAFVEQCVFAHTRYLNDRATARSLSEWCSEWALYMYETPVIDDDAAAAFAVHELDAPETQAPTAYTVLVGRVTSRYVYGYVLLVETGRRLYRTRGGFLAHRAQRERPKQQSE